MAEILMVNLPFSGHTNPTLPLAAALVRRGHRVSYINAEAYRDSIEKTGAEFIPYINYPASPTSWQRTTMCFRAAFDTALSLERKFDLLLYELFFYPGYRIAQILGIPHIRQFSQPAVNRDTISHSAFVFRFSTVLLKKMMLRKKDAECMGIANRTIAGIILDDHPPLNIVYAPSLFQPDRESFGADYVYTVPMNESGSQSLKIPYEKMRSPIVYISLGTVISDKRFYKKCIRAFGKQEMSVILNTGKVRPERLGRVPDHIYPYSFVPQVEVLRHADVFLTHCGMNSVQEAMSNATPMVAMPIFFDQSTNAKRIVELGIAKKLRFIPCSGRKIVQIVKEVYADAQFKSRITDIQERLRNETTMEETIDRIERLLR